jgi:hypothetical protein
MSILGAFIAFHFCSPFLLDIFVYLLMSQFPNTSFTTGVKVESLLLIKERGMKTWKGVEVKLRSLLLSAALDWGASSASAALSLPPVD